jgi:hypothetical protein
MITKDPSGTFYETEHGYEISMHFSTDTGRASPKDVINAAAIFAARLANDFLPPIDVTSEQFDIHTNSEDSAAKISSEDAGFYLSLRKDAIAETILVFPDDFDADNESREAMTTSEAQELFDLMVSSGYTSSQQDS